MDNQEKNKDNLSEGLLPQVIKNKNDVLQSLLEENLAMTKEIRAMVRHINVYVAWRRIFGWLKMFIILVPIIVGIIYLPPIIRDAYNDFMQLIAGGITLGVLK
jgi:hypothetical protein